MKLLKIILIISTLFTLQTIQFLHAMQPSAPIRESKVGKKLSEIIWSSAGVLPFFYENGKKYVLLSRESRGRRKGTYADFGGSRDKTPSGAWEDMTSITMFNNYSSTGTLITLSEKHPVHTASREFWEEAILDLTIGFNPKQTREYIDQRNKNTNLIIACQVSSAKTPDTYSVSYITDFTEHVDTFTSNFFKARKHAIDNPTTRNDQQDKDIIAYVEWDAFKDAICTAKQNANSPVIADTIIKWDQKTKKIKTEHAVQITLHKNVISMYLQYFTDRPFEQGDNPKVRFYSWQYEPTFDEKKLFEKRNELEKTLRSYSTPSDPTIKNIVTTQLKEAHSNTISIYNLSEKLIAEYMKLTEK